MSNEHVENASDVLARNLRAEIREMERGLAERRETLARAEALIAKRRSTTDSVTLAITHDPDDLPRVGDVYEGREVVDRAESNDGRSVTLWFAEET